MDTTLSEDEYYSIKDGNCNYKKSPYDYYSYWHSKLFTYKDIKSGTACDNNCTFGDRWDYQEALAIKIDMDNCPAEQEQEQEQEQPVKRGWFW